MKLEKATQSAKIILSSTEKLLAEAEKHLLDGDEELAYYFFYRYVEAIAQAQKRDDYKKDKKFYENLISKHKFKAALDKLDSLTDSLQKRYNLKKEVEDLESAAIKKEFSEALENEKNLNHKRSTDGKDRGALSSGDGFKAAVSSVNGIVKANGTDKIETVKSNGITPQELKTLLEQKVKRMLLVDCRDRTDFTNNHILHSNCICIPATALAEGMSANTILSTMKECNPESYMDWNNRGSFDYIILYDWNSSFDHRSPGLGIVYDAVTKWDQDCKNAKILVVQGGMKNMYYTYPNLLTNPQTNVNATTKQNGSTDVDLRKLESISYPDLEDTTVTPKSYKPLDGPETNNISLSNFEHDRISSAPSSYPNINDVPKIGGVHVDRSTKPSRLSSQKVPNGPATVASTIAISTNESTDKTDIKVKEYSEALDAVIESTNETIKREKEAKALRELAAAKEELDTEMENKLKAKEVEAESLRTLLDTRNEQLSQMKSQYESVLREQKTKHILPRIRTPVEEENISSKQREKDSLDELVKALRKARIDAGTEKGKRERSVPSDKDRSNDYVSLPPISNSNAGQVSNRASSVTSATQLPSISPATSVAPEIISSPVPSLKPSSSNAGSSRPISQDSSAITRQKLKDENSEPPRSSALKRSHSHPNIAQSHDEDMGDESGNSQVPRINRGLKPTRAQAPEVATPRRFARNFEVVSSTERSKTGLKNLGNTCYMNSIIQCLSHTIRLVDYLRSEEYMREWHPGRSPTKGEATEELSAAIKQMHSGHRSISLLDLKSTIGKHHRAFRGYEQQDSHEFITILLDWLHEEMNRAPEKTPLKEQKNDGLSDEVAATRTWDDYKKSNDSKISELFCGQQKSCVTCSSCSTQSVTFEPFFILSVPIPISGKKCDIQQCIDFYTTEEELSGWNCVQCKRKVRATKKIDLWRLPPYLIIHLQRFYNDGYWKKRLTEIDFPVENLNLNPKVIGKDRNTSYDFQLYAVSNHYGSMDGGHYTAYCRQNGNWLRFDDLEVCPINGRDVPSAAAYILFYQNRNYC
ncbi:Ubiquitin carboxyl-terminal hydrolase 8 [Orchesella cincta]|uniref:ubiquitinyl hydrolase 1 n=1 Tax=Orchesella cincta TaxID=48709 RepID=A0A1D2N799_ORCCI|nr:Ubiquitin carboxyl-terminal hydrolase 8 [Orchesella cincta]